MPDNTKIAVITNVIPQYREDMYSRLLSEYGDRMHVYCQSHIRGMNLNTVHEKFSDNITIVNTLSLKKEKLCWQFIPILKIIKSYDIIFFYGNPRVLSNILWSLMLKALGKKIVIWGQYHTASSSHRMKNIRLCWWSLFDYIFLYTDKEASQYRQLYPDVRYVAGMNNGLNQDEIKVAIETYPQEILNHWVKDNILEGKIVLLSCARLNKKNLFNMVIDVLPDIIRKYPDVLWCVIGDGEEKESLKIKADELGVSNYIRWLGPIYDQDELAPWFLSARCLIHPGSIGLSLIHAMGYGLPVITHDNEKHQMPEIAALVDGENGLLFKEADSTSLINKILFLLENEDVSHKLSTQAKQTVADNYNTKMMAKRFIGMVNKIEAEM